MNAELGYSASFAAGLLDPRRATPELVTGPNGKAAEKRYNVYRNNVTVSLIEALSATFPATLRITGVDFFRAMARTYMRQEPPTSPLLFEYGSSFPDFIAHYEYARGMPWLPDVARIERAWLDAYHAADAEPLSPHSLAGLTPAQLEAAVLAPHPATRIVRSNYPAVTIFAANRSPGPVGRITTTAPEDALVTRPGLEVTVRRLPPGGADFLAHLIAGETLGAAAEAGAQHCPAFDLGANIKGMLAAGAFTTLGGGRS